MGRISIHTDEKLIKYGTALARKKGLSGFSVRELCSKANVNLGMFHYHFKNKENFDKQVLTALYKEMIQDLGVQVSPMETPRQNVESILLKIHHFAQKNRVIFSAMASDVLNGDKQILQFVMENMTSHVGLLMQELKRAQLAPAAQTQPLLSVAITLALPIVVPQIAAGSMERLGEKALPDKLKKAPKDLWEDSTARQRIEVVLNGVFGEEK